MKRVKRTLHASCVQLVFLALAVLASCGPQATTPKPTPPSPDTSQTAPQIPAATPIPLVERPLTRRDLIENAAIAAGEFAHSSRPSDLSKLSGRKFALRLPFNCSSLPNRPDDQALAAADAKRKTLKLFARPMEWTDSPLLEGKLDDIEKAEGFWIPQPWMFAETCPKGLQPQTIEAQGDQAREDEAQQGPSPETLGLVRLFEKGGSRILRRDGRAYEFAMKRSEAATDENPFFLLLEGRLSQFGNGNVIACWTKDARKRPICLYAVEFTHVAFQDVNGETLAEWSN